MKGSFEMSTIRKLLSLGGTLLLLLALVPTAFAQATPGVSVTEQPIANGKITVEKVISDGPGWIVVHAQADGKPGPIVGYTQVDDGENLNVVVEIDATRATQTLYAMLHTDAGQVGTWEFPAGPDTPVIVDDKVVTPPFNVTAGVGVADQALADGKITVAKVFSDGPGWIVIHAQADGKPGPILGYAQVSDGENLDIDVEIDVAGVTQTLYAMLHTDAGTVGTWEFPGGADVPVKAGEAVITPPFQVTGGLPTTLPETGGVPFPWAAILLGLGALTSLTGLGLAWARRPR